MEACVIQSDVVGGGIVDRQLAAIAAIANSQKNTIDANNLNASDSDLGLVMNSLLQQQPSTLSLQLPAVVGCVHTNISGPNVIQPPMIQQLPSAANVSALSHSLHSVTIPNTLQSGALQPPFQTITIPPIPVQLHTDIIAQNLIAQQNEHQLSHLQQQPLTQRDVSHLHPLQQIQQKQFNQQPHLQQQCPIVPTQQHVPMLPPPIIHNLIPEHLQASSLAASLNGTTGYEPALILPQNSNYVNDVSMALLTAAASPVSGSTAAAVAVASQLGASLVSSHAVPQPQLPTIPTVPLTVQDRHTLVPPVFNGVNMSYPGVEAVGVDPPIFLVHNFLSHAECDFLINAAEDVWQPAPVVGKGSGEISPSRTSSTSFLAREDLPDYMRKVSALTSKPIEHCELPQVGRYLPSQQYKHHFDAFDLSNEDGRRFAQNGGQRVVTVLVYLNDCLQGGQTDFPAMNIQVAPRKGMAVVFFPATVDGYLDKRAIHAALPAIDTKYVSQVWIRQGPYTGSPSKRLAQPMVSISYG